MECKAIKQHAAKISTLIFVGTLFAANTQAAPSCDNQDVLDNFAQSALDLKLMDPDADVVTSAKQVIADFGVENPVTVGTLVSYAQKNVPDNQKQLVEDELLAEVINLTFEQAASAAGGNPGNSPGNVPEGTPGQPAGVGDPDFGQGQASSAGGQGSSPS